MKRACPTIQELLAFDAVARHESLTKASLALCVSLSAVSKQVSSLEKFLGMRLLQKNGRGVELTAAGRDYLSRVSPALRTIETATFELRAGSAAAGVITLASVPTFLTKWLIPRLVDFRSLNPGVTFSFSQHLSLSEPIPADVDAAIRYGTGNWPGVRSDYIAGREFVCVVCPPAARDAKRLHRGQPAAGLTLLHHEQAPLAWREWAAANRMDETQALSGPRFAQYSAIVQAAVSGLGAGLVPRVLVEDELSQGSLVVVGAEIRLDHGHYLCYQAARLERPLFAAFRSWILSQGQAETAPPRR